jgi:hypothetical protein
MAEQYRKKPVVIEAVQINTRNEADSTPGICTGGTTCKSKGAPEDAWPHIHSLEGDHTWTPGDWMITGVKGEQYFCKPDIFAATYEPASTPPLPGNAVEEREALLSRRSNISDAELAAYSRGIGKKDDAASIVRALSNELIAARASLASTSIPAEGVVPASGAAEVHPFAYAYRYPGGLNGGTVIRFSHGEEVNGSKPIETIPLYTLPAILSTHAGQQGDWATDEEIGMLWSAAEIMRLNSYPAYAKALNALRTRLLASPTAPQQGTGLTEAEVLVMSASLVPQAATEVPASHLNIALRIINRLTGGQGEKVG